MKFNTSKKLQGNGEKTDVVENLLQAPKMCNSVFIIHLDFLGPYFSPWKKPVAILLSFVIKKILDVSMMSPQESSSMWRKFYPPPAQLPTDTIICISVLLEIRRTSFCALGFWWIGCQSTAIAFPSHTKVTFEISQQICSWGIWDFGNIPSFLTTFTSWHPRNGIRIQKLDEARTKMMFNLCVKESRHECDSAYVLLSEPEAGIQKGYLHVNHSSHSHLLISSGKRSKQGSNLL